jgi:beta-glucanase (GH16 family)
MKKTFLFSMFCICFLTLNANDANNPDTSAPPVLPGYKLMWNDEFDYDGKPNPDYWGYETGFVRNEELQWYQSDNAVCKNHTLVIEGKRETRENPNYKSGSSSWKESRRYINYTSSSILTRNKKSFKFGRFEIRARIPVDKGAWPAIWTLGVNEEWPSNGEIDILELYLKSGKPAILANAAWGTSTRWVAQWNSSYKYLLDIMFEAKDENWADKFHIWRMDWDEEFINIYLDDKVLNSIDLSKTKNPNGFNPFHQEHYMILNLALGSNGGDPSLTDFPLFYEVDYVRVYQKDSSSSLPTTPSGNRRITYPGQDNKILTIYNDDSSSSSGVASICNFMGQQLARKIMQGNTTRFDFSSFPAGTYILNLSGDGKSESHKFVYR